MTIGQSPGETRRLQHTPEGRGLAWRVPLTACPQKWGHRHLCDVAPIFPAKTAGRLCRNHLLRLRVHPIPKPPHSPHPMLICHLPIISAYERMCPGRIKCDFSSMTREYDSFNLKSLRQTSCPIFELTNSSIYLCWQLALIKLCPQ